MESRYSRTQDPAVGVREEGRPGEADLVTDQGGPVARPAITGGTSMVDRGIEEGWITPPSKAGLEPIEPCKVSTSTSEVLDEDRG